jgi:hypothetical protein
MRSIRSTRRVTGALFAAASLAAAASAAAQTSSSASIVHISPYVGYMVFGNYLKGPLGTSLSNAPGVLYGSQVAMSLSPSLSLVGNLGYTSSDMKVGLPFIGGVSVGQSTMLIYDGDLEYKLGSSRASGFPFSPFVQAGIGAIRYRITESVLQTETTNVAGNVGIGADITVRKGMALRVLAKDYIGKFNFQDAVGLGITGETAHNFGLTVGMRFDF